MSSYPSFTGQSTSAALVLHEPSHENDYKLDSHLGAEESVALPAANKALIGANLGSKEAGDNTRLLGSSVKRQMPAVGKLEDADAVLDGEVSLAAAAGASDDETASAAVY